MYTSFILPSQFDLSVFLFVLSLDYVLKGAPCHRFLLVIDIFSQGVWGRTIRSKVIFPLGLSVRRCNGERGVN